MTIRKWSWGGGGGGGGVGKDYHVSMAYGGLGIFTKERFEICKYNAAKVGGAGLMIAC